MFGAGGKGTSKLGGSVISKAAGREHGGCAVDRSSALLVALLDLPRRRDGVTDIDGPRAQLLHGLVGTRGLNKEETNIDLGIRDNVGLRI